MRLLDSTPGLYYVLKGESDLVMRQVLATYRIINGAGFSG